MASFLVSNNVNTTAGLILVNSAMAASVPPNSVAYFVPCQLRVQQGPCGEWLRPASQTSRCDAEVAMPSCMLPVGPTQSESAASTECGSVHRGDSDASLNGPDFEGDSCHESEGFAPWGEPVRKSQSEPWNTGRAEQAAVPQVDVRKGGRRGRGVPVKNTFIHIESERPRMGGRLARRAKSAPPAVVPLEPGTPCVKVSAAHLRGTCRPCAYFAYRSDGCRNGNSCTFCHACPRGENARRKRERQARRRAAQEALKEEEDC